MKKILIIGVIILSIFLIYLTTIDKKVYYLALGDQISLGMTEDGYYKKSYTEYVKDYLDEKNKLEIFVSDFQTQGYHITDIINDINNNKEIEETEKTIKNALIKADLITIAIGTNDIISKIDEEKKLTRIDYNKLIKNINQISNDLEILLKQIREYCKEDIILIGINIYTENEKITEIIKYANEKFEEISKKYNITYINQLETTQKRELNIYPTEEEYKSIGDKIINIINEKLLNS